MKIMPNNFIDKKEQFKQKFWARNAGQNSTNKFSSSECEEIWNFISQVLTEQQEEIKEQAKEIKNRLTKKERVDNNQLQEDNNIAYNKGLEDILSELNK